MMQFLILFLSLVTDCFLFGKKCGNVHGEQDLRISVYTLYSQVITNSEKSNIVAINSSEIVAILSSGDLLCLCEPFLNHI